MNLRTERNALNAALAKVRGIVDGKSTMPILNNFLLQARDGILSITATDMDMAATVQAVADVEVPGNTTVNAGTLYDIVKKLPDGPITLTGGSDAASPTLVVKQGRRKYELATIQAVEFPTMDGKKAEATVDLPAKTLVNALNGVGFAASTEEARYFLNGVNIRATGALCATDGHRLAKLVVDELAGQGVPDIIIPNKAVRELVKIAADADSVSLAISASLVRVTAGDTVFTTKLVDGTFPDYERVIPRGNANRATVDRKALLDAIARVITVSGEKSKAIKLEFGGEVARLSCRAELSSAEEEVDVRYTGAPLTIGFNGIYLSDVLRAAESNEVDIIMGDPMAPVIIAVPDDGERVLIVMPMRA